MIRTSISRARRALTGLALGTGLALTPAPAHAFWDTQKAWNDVLQFAVRQVNAPGEFEIILGEVTKPEEGFALISTLQIKDSDGVWFDADNLLVDWSASALLRGRFTFETLSAEQITVLRAPIGRGAPPAEDAPDIAFAWPRAPVPIAIDTLRIDRLRLEGGLLPQDLEASVEGGFSDIGDVQEAELAIQRTDRPGDRIALSSRIDFDDLDIAFTLEATEEPGGLVAQVANLPPDQALEMRLEAEGTPEALPFELFADIGQIGIATGQGEARWAERIAARFEGTVEPGEETSADWRRALGEAARITVDFEETANGTYALETLGIDSEAFELSGKGVVDVGRNAIDMALDWDVKDVAAFNQVIAPAKVTDLTGTARATGALTAPKLDVNARVAGLEAGFGTADAILLRIDSQPVDGEIGAVGKQQGFDFEARAEGLALADAGIQSALGPTPSLTGSGRFDGIAQLVTLETLAIDARSVRLDGSAAYNIAIGAADAALSGEARELGPFFRAAGLPIDGRAALSFELDGLQGGTLDRLALEARMTDLSSDDPDIAAALGEEAVLEVLLTESGAETIRVERGILDSEVLRVEASGTVSVPNDAVDLAVEFDLRDAAAVSALVEPGRIASARGDAVLTGTLSEPEVRLFVNATGLGFEAYAAETARIEGDVQYRLDRRAPFDATVALTGVTTGDPALDRVLGDAPEVAARGLYDTATGLLSLETAQVDLADADVGLAGDIHLRRQTLDITYDLDAGDLSGFEGLAGVPLAGSVDLSGSAEGAFTLPFVTAKGSVRNLRYDTYAVEAADIDIEMDSAADGPAPFRLDVTATNPRTGDPDLDALIGTSPSLRAQGTLDRAGPAVELESFDADFAALKAEAQGSVDLGTRLLDLTFDVEAERLDGLSGILGTEIAGAVTARGSASGSFEAPQVDATVDGRGLRYDTYAVGAIAGRIDVEQAASGFAPFDVDIEARDVTTGDPALDDLLAGASTLRAKGEYNQADQQVRIEAASARVAGAEADLSGEIDIARRFVDVDFDVSAADLAPFEALAGVPLAGSVSATGEARGELTAPQLDIELEGRGLRYDTYVVAAIAGDIDVRQAETGFAPFDVDVTASGIETGDPALDDVLDGEASLRARGGFDASAQRVRIEAATLRAAGAQASLSGDVDIAARALDVAFDLKADDLSAFEGLAGVPLAGAVSARGTAGGDLSEPTLDLTLSGQTLRYDAYRVGALDGTVALDPRDGDFAPFSVDLTARDLATGDAGLDEALAGGIRVDAAGGLDLAGQRLRLDRADLATDALTVDASGAVDLGGRTLDIRFDLDADDLAPLSSLAGTPLAGSLDASGTAAGPFVLPEVDVMLEGRRLRYDAYRVGALDGTVALDRRAENGFAPFSVDLDARDLATGDAGLDEALAGGIRVDAAGALDLDGRRLRLDRADLATDALTVDASGTVDLGGQRLDIRFDLDADNLDTLSSLAGTPLAGSLEASGTARGPFVLPEVDVTLAGEGLRYDAYRVGALDGTVALDRRAENGFAPFLVDLDARDLATGDAGLDEALAGGIRVDAAGGLDLDGQRLRLDRADLATDALTVDATGTVDLGGQRLDIRFDLDADDLGTLSSLAGTPLAGSLEASGTARGPFVLPEVDVTLAGEGLRYDAYSIAAVEGTAALDGAASGLAPFDVDLTARGIRTGDPALDGIIGGTVALDATGGFDRTAQRLRLDAASLDSDFATAEARGSVDLGARTLDMTFDVDAKRLAALEPLLGVPVGGAVAVEGTARGPFSLPAVDVALSARNLVYDAYGAGALDGTVRLDAAENGFAPFDVDLRGEALSLGDPALEAALGTGVTVDARGAVNVEARRIRLDAARIVTAAATVAATGSVDLSAQRLDVAFDVEAGDLSPFGPLAGADLGGALSLSGSASGPFVIPRVNADISGANLRYRQYGIASLTGSVTMEAPENGVTPFDIGLAAAGIATGDAALDGALAGGISLDAQGGADLAAQRVRLDAASLRTPFADVSASGTADLKARSLDMRFALDADDLSPLSAVVGTPMGGSLRASGTARGTLDAPMLNLDADGAKLFFGEYGLSGLSLDLEMPGDAPGYLPFSLTGALSGPRLNDAQLEALVGPRIDLRAAGVFDPSRQLLRLTDAQVGTAAAGVAAFGDIDLAAGLLDVNAYLDARDLSVAQPFAGATLAGSAQARARISGALTDPTVVGRLSGANLVYDTYDVPELTAFYELRSLTGGPAGSVAVNARTDVGPLSAKARFDLGGGTTRIEELTVQGLGLGVDGRFALVGGLATGEATLTATDLGRLGAFIGQPLAGQVNGTVSLDGMQGRQNATFDVLGSGLRYGPADDPTVRLSVFNAKGQVSDAFGANPFVDATIGGGEGVVAGVELARLDATARGSFSALDVTLAARGGALGSDRIETAARLNIAGQPRSAVVSRLALLYDGRQASIVQPVVIEEIPPGGVRVTGLDLRAEDGAMRGALEYSASGLVADLDIRNFPLTLANLAGVDVIRSGRLDGTVDVDTRGGARGTLALEAYALRLAGAQIDDPFAITATGAMNGSALTFRAEMSGAQLVQPLTASARIPLMASGGPLPLPDRNAPFSAQVDWQGDVGEVWAFVPLPDHILTGPVVLRGRAGGTLAAPSLSGGAVLSDGRYSNVEFGTLLTALNVQADFTQDGRAVFEMTANDGVQGTVAASGSYVVADGTLDTRLALNNAALVRRDDATAILSGEATAVSRGKDIAVTGDFRTNYVELRLIGNFGGGLTVVDAIPVGETAPLYTPPAEETETDRRILLDVSLSMPNRVFVRGRGLDSEWGGRLDVAGTARNPRVNGLIERRRGVLDFLGRQFELAIGIVRFTGDVMPFVQVRLQREANDITGWIEVIGDVPDVELEFGSVPALPEGEVLPRLLFGRSQQSLTALEAAQLAAGVATLLSGRAGVLDSVRDAVGVDVLRVESDVDGGTSIITGKYLRDEVFVGAKQNLQRGETSGLVEIEVFDDFEIEAELGSEEAKGSVGWQIEY